jgi:hypothetical protein
MSSPKTWQVHALAAALEGVASMATYEPEDDPDPEAPSGDAVFHFVMEDVIIDLLSEARAETPRGAAYLTGAPGRAVVVLAYPRAELYYAALEGSSHWVTLAPDGVAESHPTALDAARAVWGRAAADRAEAGPVAGADAPRYRLWLSRQEVR